VGSTASNLALGQQRAAAGRALLGAGFANRAAALGRGEVSFVAPNNTEASKAQNRRIVFTVVRP
jgi:outer membrane protein OmpA-like peptidoglycan-associated protein